MKDTQALMVMSAVHALRANTRPSEGAAHAICAGLGNLAAALEQGMRRFAPRVLPASIQIRWERPRMLRAMHAHKRSTLKLAGQRNVMLVYHVLLGSTQAQ